MKTGRACLFAGLLLSLAAAHAGDAPAGGPRSPPGATGGERNGGSLGNAWSDPRNPIAQLFHGDRLDLWSLKPVRRPPVPKRTATLLANAGALNPIDAFVDAGLARVGLTRSSEADPRTLARRVCLDLTGLPPEPDAMDRFLADGAPGAYERWVDRLLSSQAYGEHQARLWLDVVRYSDSNGFDWDEFRPQAWRYRDYVIRSFNHDKPFDRFVCEQLAGDEMLPGPPTTPAEQDELIATGYLRIGPQDNSAPLFNEQARARSEWLVDLTETTGSAFLGLTLGCCRCHDHKFDPLSKADHYRIRAFFEPLIRGDDVPLDLAGVQEEIRRQHVEVEARLRPLREQRAALLVAARERMRKAAADAATVPTSATPGSDTPATLSKRTTPPAKPSPPRGPSEDEVRQSFSPEEKEKDAELARSIMDLEASRRRFTTGLIATDTTNAVPPTHILAQGDYREEREAVEPGFLSILDPNPAGIRPPPNPATTGRRLALARWIASSSNPLTARVFVNRAWQSFFGEGLVATPNDFGLAGAPPTHPELLDWLASEFMEQGWSVKHLQRLIVTSATYRQTSQAHPGSRLSASHRESGGGFSFEKPAANPEAVDETNTLLWRQNLRRLSAEEVRDSMLAAGGALRLCAGGPPVWPELPREVLQANPAFLDDNAEKTKGWYPSPAAGRTVRSVYLVQKRTVPVPFLETFDLPGNAVSCPRRTGSIVAPQALALLNSAEAVDAVRAFAKRIARDVGTDPEAQVRRAFACALQRPPARRELESCEAFLRHQSLLELCRALLNLNEFMFED